MSKNVMLTVRTGSSRLPKKCLLGLNNMTIFSHVVNRCRKFDLNPIIATTTEPEDQILIDLARSMNVRCYAGFVEDKMRRWLYAANIFGIKKFAVVDVDDPFFDPILTHEVLDLTKQHSFVLPDMHAYLGSHGMGVDVESLQDACKSNAKNGIFQTEMCWKYLEKSNVFEFIIDDVDVVEHNLRLTVDYQEDYWLATVVARELGLFCTRQEIIHFFRTNPGLRMINDFRNADWKLRQASQ